MTVCPCDFIFPTQSNKGTPKRKCKGFSSKSTQWNNYCKLFCWHTVILPKVHCLYSWGLINTPNVFKPVESIFLVFSNLYCFWQLTVNRHTATFCGTTNNCWYVLPLSAVNRNVYHVAPMLMECTCVLVRALVEHYIATSWTCASQHCSTALIVFTSCRGYI